MRDFKAKYHLGQNFLTDTNLLDRLTELSSVESGEVVLEVGCGRGDLTAALLRRGAIVHGIEIDDDLIPFLENRFSSQLLEGQLILHHADARQVDWSTFSVSRLLSNVPYYLTRYLLRQAFVQQPTCKTMGFTLQLEAADRLLAGAPGDTNYQAKLYGPLAILRTFYGKSSITHRFKRGDFTPAPRVDSVFIVVEQGDQDDFYTEHARSCAEILEVAFEQRRKTLANNWRQSWSWEAGELTGFLVERNVEGKRAEEIRPEEWLELCKAIYRRFHNEFVHGKDG